MGEVVTYSIVVIDDVREPIPMADANMQVCRTWEEGLAALQEVHARRGWIDELWLDHDLGIDHGTGDYLTIMPVVEWLEEMAYVGTPLDVRWIFVHTSNYLRADVMVTALEKWYRHVVKDVLPCV